MNIVHVTADHAAIWAQLCHELWPDHAIEYRLEAFGNGECPHEYICFVGNVGAAFMSLSVRHDYVEGKPDANPVGYLEGIYVKPEFRGHGIAKALVHHAKAWSAMQGCSILASDCELDNEGSRLFHQKIGFDEVGINVHFTMNLR